MKNDQAFSDDNLFRYPSTIDMLNQLVRLYEAWGKPEKAEEWRAKLSQTEAADK